MPEKTNLSMSTIAALEEKWKMRLTTEETNSDTTTVPTPTFSKFNKNFLVNQPDPECYNL